MLVLCALLAVVGASNDGFMRADAELGLVDSVGRQRFFRGVNVVVKRAPWLPSLSAAWDPFSSYNTRDMAQLQAWGFNIVRLGVMWPGVNPHSSNAVNATYLAEAARLVDAAAGYGIVTLLDLHQDLASPFFCGEGFPDYLVAPPGGLSSFPLPVSLPYKTNSSTGYPVSCPKSFGEYYATAAVAEAFQALYDNARGLADAFVGYWSAVSSFFASNTNVVGLELLNEPFAGDFFREPSLLEPGVTDLLYLTPLYARAIAAIRRNDAKHIIFFEPMVADVGPVGFDAAPDKNSVLSYHVYCSSQPSKADRKLCWGELEATFWMRQEDRRRMGVAAMQTEFGAVGDGEESIATLRQQVDMCEREGQSFIYWAFKYFGDPTTSVCNLAWLSNSLTH